MNQLVLSLFPGIGLLDMAFEEEGFCVVRGPDLLWGGDIRRFHPPAGRFDGVIGGPPCQAFSAMSNLSHARGKTHENLIPDFERVVREAQPSWFVMENVPGAPLPEVPGYMVQDQLVNNRHCGGEQNRMRRFSFAARMRPLSDGARRLPRFFVEGEALEPARWAAAVTSAHSGERRTHSSKITTWGKITRYKIPEARLQGLPETYLDGAPFTAEGKLKALANGVPLPLGRAVARAVKRALGIEAEAA